MADRMLWRRRAAVGVLGVWALVSLARLTRLVGPPEEPPGQELAATLEFFRATIPTSAGYVFVEPGEFGTDTGLGQRLRYELYPRAYDKVRPSVDQASVRELMRREALSYVVVPDARLYPVGFWLSQPQEWLRRVDLDSNRYVLAVIN